jgi:hypothetical protein
MPRFDYRFDIAAILLASVLTAVGLSTAHAGGRPTGGGCGDVHSRSGSASASPSLDGGKGGVTGGDVRSRGGASASPALDGGKGGVSGGDVRSRGGSAAVRQ